MQKQLVKIVQVASIPMISLLTTLIVKRRNIQLKLLDITQDKSYVIVANHRGMPDPFIIGYGMRASLVYKITPLRFFTQNRFFKNPLLIPLLVGYGCFPARHETGRNSGINFSLELLKDNQNLVIFPEGKVGKFDRAIFPRTGVEVLANESNVWLIPARVKWSRKRGIFKSYSLSIGKPFSGKNMTAEQIMDVVYSLKFS
jgi:1-acyl-sn-glycerol-3-phosphate acyltransferase